MTAETKTIPTPWAAYSEGVPLHLDYPNCAMVDLVEKSAAETPDVLAYTFYTTKVNYKTFLEEIRQCAKSLAAMGIKPGDKVTICMPNAPQAVVMFYALNYMGAIANMVHPLSAQEEIAFYLKESGSVAALTLRQFYPKFQAIRSKLTIDKLIITGIEDALHGPMKLGYLATQGRRLPKIPADDSLVLHWKDFIRNGKNQPDPRCPRKGNDTAAILYSGGTTGTTKGICSATSTSTRWACRPVQRATASKKAIKCSPSCLFSTALVWASASIRY